MIKTIESLEIVKIKVIHEILSIQLYLIVHLFVGKQRNSNPIIA